MFGLFGRQSKGGELPPPKPERLTYVVGDIHGNAALLDTLLARIEADRSGSPADLVFLGDYVDRGPDSAGVLRTLFSLAPKAVRVVCLMGNHERMMLDFLEAPEDAGPRWLANGGTDTIVSFVTGRSDANPVGSKLQAVRDRLRCGLGPDLEDWLQSLPLSFLTGSLGCVHAITDPSRPWGSQTAETLLWGRPHKKLPARADGIWVAHGHTIVSEPDVARGRIALDTGAYLTGTLTALRCDSAGLRFISIRAGDV